jgi:hypothetical protein
MDAGKRAIHLLQRDLDRSQAANSAIAMDYPKTTTAS